MTPQFARALVLIQQDRYEQALGELQLHLGQHPEDGDAHAQMAHCLLQLERYDEAQQQAQQAIHLAPDESIGYGVLAEVLTTRNRLPEAEQAVELALQMDPHNPADLFGLKAIISAKREKWREAIAAADAGLAVDPDNLVCLNARAQAQTMLGDRAGAARTVEDALRKNPDDPWIHANQGWACLHANQPTQAAEHFREALRLDPDLDFARAGIIEALKARNFLYRWMLQYFLWMSRMPGQYRWGIVIGMYVLFRFLSGLGRNNPALQPYVMPILFLYIGFALLTWLSYPLFNMLLRFDRFGRHALNNDQRSGANLLAATLAVALAFIIGFFAIGAEYLLTGAIVFGLLSLPVSAIFVADAGWPRQTMLACTAALLVAGLLFILPTEAALAIGGVPLERVSEIAASVFTFGIIGSQFLANSLMGVRVRK